jgi:hypothetical protein
MKEIDVHLPTNYKDLPASDRDMALKNALVIIETNVFENENLKKRKMNMSDMSYCSFYENYLAPSKRMAKDL